MKLCTATRSPSSHCPLPAHASLELRADPQDSTIVNPTDTPPRPTKRQRKSRRAASTATSPLPTYSTHDASINESDTPPEDAQAVEALLPALELASLPAPNAVRQYPPLPTRNRAASISMLPPFGPSPSSLFSQTIYDVPSHFDPSIERVPHFAASSSSNSDLHNRAALPGTTSGSTGSPASVIVRTPQTDARSIIRGMASSMVHPTRTSSSASGSMLPPASTSASSASRRMMWSRDGKSVAGDNLQGAMSAMEEAVSREQEIDKVVDEREVQHGRRSALDQLLTNRID